MLNLYHTQIFHLALAGLLELSESILLCSLGRCLTPHIARHTPSRPIQDTPASIDLVGAEHRRAAMMAVDAAVQAVDEVVRPGALQAGPATVAHGVAPEAGARQAGAFTVLEFICSKDHGASL